MSLVTPGMLSCPLKGKLLEVNNLDMSYLASQNSMPFSIPLTLCGVRAEEHRPSNAEPSANVKGVFCEYQHGMGCRRRGEQRM